MPNYTKYSAAIYVLLRRYNCSEYTYLTKLLRVYRFLVQRKIRISVIISLSRATIAIYYTSYWISKWFQCHVCTYRTFQLAKSVRNELAVPKCEPARTSTIRFSRPSHEPALSAARKLAMESVISVSWLLFTRRLHFETFPSITPGFEAKQIQSKSVILGRTLSSPVVSDPLGHFADHPGLSSSRRTTTSTPPPHDRDAMVSCVRGARARDS